MIPIDYNTLIHSISYYLSYQDRIGRSFMVNESSLKYPVADYLTSLKMSSANIRVEYYHPFLQKRQIDLIITDDSQNIETAFEFKLAQSHTKYEAEQKRIFNDLMRLYLLSKTKATSAYFVVAGKESDFIQSFRSIPSERPKSNIKKDLPEPKGFYTKWFTFKANESQTFNIKNASDSEYVDIYNAFLNKYKLQDSSITLDLPDTLITKCIAISALSRDFPTPYVAGVWKIE